MVQGIPSGNPFDKAIEKTKQETASTVGNSEADAYSIGMGHARAAERDAFGNGSPDVKFNDNGDKVGVEYKLPDGTITGSATFDPDTGRITSKSRYQNGVISSKETYDLTGKTTEKTTFDANGNPKQIDNYDSNGIISRSTLLDSVTGKSFVSDFNYQGQKTETLIFDNNGKLLNNTQIDPATGNTTSSTSFDAQGNITSQSHFKDDVITDSTEFYPGTNQPQRIVTYAYDSESGGPVPTSYKTYYPNGQAAHIEEYNLDTGKYFNQCFYESGALKGERYSNDDGSSVINHYDETTGIIDWSQQDPPRGTSDPGCVKTFDPTTGCLTATGRYDSSTDTTELITYNPDGSIANQTFSKGVGDIFNNPGV